LPFDLFGGHLPTIALAVLFISPYLSFAKTNPRRNSTDSGMKFPPDHRQIQEIPDRISPKMEKLSRNPQWRTDPGRKATWISRCLEGQGLGIG